MVYRIISLLALLIASAQILRAGVIEVSEILSVSLKVEEIAVIDIGPSGLRTSIAITTDCPNDEAYCATGEAAIEFGLYGNSSVDISLFPEQTAFVNDRQFGVFTPQSGDQDSTVIYFDLVLLIEDATRQVQNLKLPILSRSEALKTSANWKERANLSTGRKRVKVFLRPVFDWTNPDNIASPGIYVAYIGLSIASY